MNLCLKCNTTERYENGRCKSCARTAALLNYHKSPESRKRKNKKATEWKQNNRERARQFSRKGGRSDWLPGEHEKAEARRAMISFCEVCGANDPRHKRGWNADHCHATGLFRGIVCHPCNIAISHVEKFGIDRGVQIASYLTRYQNEN